MEGQPLQRMRRTWCAVPLSNLLSVLWAFGTRRIIIASRSHAFSPVRRRGSARLRRVIDMPRIKDLQLSRKKVLDYIDRYTTRIVVVLLWYCVIWSILGNDAFPKDFAITRQENSTFEWQSKSSNMGNQSFLMKEDGQQDFLDIPSGHFFSLYILFVFSALLGRFTRLIYLPPLTGMLTAGFILRNVPHISFAADIHPLWSSTIRNICLVVVLIRGGLSLDSRQLKRLKVTLFLLAILPCICEGAVDGIVATFLLPLPWKWGLMLGYVTICTWQCPNQVYYTLICCACACTCICN